MAAQKSNLSPLLELGFIQFWLQQGTHPQVTVDPKVILPLSSLWLISKLLSVLRTRILNFGQKITKIPLHSKGTYTNPNKTIVSEFER